MRVFGCSKFKRLASEELDRELSHKERAFLQKHREVCTPCSEMHEQSCLALNFLRAATLDVEVHPSFEDRVLRKLRVQTTRESIRYWSPAVAGAFVAGLAVIAALQMITRSAELPHVRYPGGEARRITMPKSLPDFHSSRNVSINR